MPITCHQAGAARVAAAWCGKSPARSTDTSGEAGTPGRLGEETETLPGSVDEATPGGMRGELSTGIDAGAAVGIAGVGSDGAGRPVETCFESDGRC